MPSREIEPAADDEADAGRLRRLMRAHDAGEAVAVGDRDRLVAERRRGRHQLVRMRGAAQEREIAGDLQLGVAGRSGEDAMDKPARRRGPCRARPGAEQPEAPPLLVLDPVIVADRVGVAEPSASTIPRRSAPARRRAHPVRAPPPGEAERRVVGQQPERLDRLRRREQPDRARRLAEAPARPSPAARSSRSLPRNGGGSGWGLGADRRSSTDARSGMWLSRGSSRPSAASPSRAPRRSSSGAKPPPQPSPACGERRQCEVPICSAGSGSTAKAARIMSSTPRPGSTVSSRAAKRPARWRGSRLGRAVPRRMCSTRPSTR